jgi:hypothetical protein
LSVRRNPLIWALPLQAALLFWRLDLLEPWGDEWFTLTTAPQPLTEIASIVAGNIHPPLYFLLRRLPCSTFSLQGASRRAAQS